MNASVLQCCQCQRLVQYRQQIAQKFPHYHCKPVQAFGSSSSRLLIVGLAPGLHGANASGIPFTGDQSGDLLFKMLHQYGFSNVSDGLSKDTKMILKDCRITNAVKCLPPQNKPNQQEINSCNSYLKQEIEQLPDNGLILSLGQIAHKAVIKTQELKQKDFPFSHHRWHMLKRKIRMINSYHCSRYNTQTKRLTSDMFEQVFADIRSNI